MLWCWSRLRYLSGWGDLVGTVDVWCADVWSVHVWCACVVCTCEVCMCGVYMCGSAHKECGSHKPCQGNYRIMSNALKE